jgi:hypothetical protein
VHEVHCAICSKEGKEKLFVPNSITCWNQGVEVGSFNFHVNFNINSVMDSVIIEFFGEEMNCLIIEFFDFRYSINQCCLVIGGFRTYIDTRFPQNVGLCEKLLWRFYQVSNMWVGGLIS